MNRSVRGTLHRTQALVVRAVPYGESDVIVGLFAETIGRVTAMARGARSPRRRQNIVLEPMHTLDVTLRERAGQSLLQLPSSTISVPRRRLLESYDRMDAAGTALRWLRKTAPARTPEPALWGLMQSFLDLLERDSLPAPPRALLTVAGLRLLQALGYALELERCVCCGRACEEGRASYVDPARGGLVCRRCGGAPVLVPGPLRARLLQASSGKLALLDSDVPVALDLVEAALFAHADVRE